MKKDLTIFLTTSPETSGNIRTLSGLALSALEKGHIVRLIASGEGVFSLHREWAPAALNVLADKGLKISACASSLKARGLSAEDLIGGAAVEGLGHILHSLKPDTVFLNFGV